MKILKKPRSYSDFTLEHLRELFGINNIKRPLNFVVKPIEPSAWLAAGIEKSKRVALNTEKAKSEVLVAPVLIEILTRNPDRCNYFSGNTLDVDAVHALKGRCDFLLTKEPSMDITAPIIAIFEAKDDNIEHWYGQCGAEMLAARIFNEERNEPITIIHGAVTNGTEWRFLRLDGLMLYIDSELYTLGEVSKLLGALEYLIDFYHS
jgi:hypothetical protein